VKKIKLFAKTVLVINLVNFFCTFSFRINSFVRQFTRWVEMGHSNYLGKDQSFFGLIIQEFLMYALCVLPFIIIIFLVSVATIKNLERFRGVKKGILLGSLIGGGFSSVIIALSTIPRFFHIMHDGTAEWMFSLLTVFWLGYPSIIIGIGLGALVAIIRKDKT